MDTRAVLVELFHGNARKFYFTRRVAAGINHGGESRKRKKGEEERREKKRGRSDIPSVRVSGRVYVSAVADRVNVGKDEGLRFCGL